MSYRCSASRDLPLDTDKAWSGQDAENSIFEWAGFPDSPDGEKAAKGFLCWDSSAPTLRGSFKLPFATVLNGKLTALASGIRASASRLPQTDGLSDSVKADARAVIDHYEDKAHPDPGSEPDADDKGRALAGTPAVWRAPAPITRILTSADLPPSVLPQVPDPSVFHDRAPFLFRARISTNALDAYGTRMAPSSLNNYALDARNGVAFMNSHRETELPLGRSYDGHYTGPGGDGNAYTDADFYMLPGSNTTGVHTDHVIDNIRAGVLHDCSVGFHDADMRCILCGRDMLREWRLCGHVPTLPYVIRDAKGNEREEKGAAWVENAHLAEVSGVYHGATPGATILAVKARQEADLGRLLPEQARLLELRHGLRFPDVHHVWPSAAPAPEKETRMPELTLEDVRRDLRRALEINDPGIDPVTHALEIAPQLKEVRSLQAECERLRPLQEENQRLTALADLGKQYKADLLEETLAEGVRAQGNLYPLETQRALLAAATLDQLKTLKTSYAEQAKTTLAGGRVSQDRAEHDPADTAPTNGKSWTPKGAFAG